MATPPASVASMLPALRVTLMFGASMARELPPLSALMVPVPLAIVAVSSARMALRSAVVVSIVPSLFVTLTKLPRMAGATPEMSPPVRLFTVAVPPVASTAMPSVLPNVAILPALLVTLTEGPLMPNVFPLDKRPGGVGDRDSAIASHSTTHIRSDAASVGNIHDVSINHNVRSVNSTSGIVDRDRCTRNSDTARNTRVR